MPNGSGITGLHSNGGSGEGKRYLLVIAIDEYTAATGYEPLSNPVLDCTKLSEILLDRYGFQHIHPPILNDQATRLNILTVLGNLELEENDTLLVVFSGHGNLFDEEGHWACYDSQAGNDVSHVSATDLLKKLDRLTKARHIFLIVDCCFPAGIFKNSYLSRFQKDLEDKDRSRRVLTSGRNTPVPEGLPGEHSPFAKSLISILEKNDSPLSAEALRGKIQYELRKSNQNPRLDPLNLAAHEGGEFEFMPKGYSQEKPDPQELRNAIFQIRYPGAWWDDLYTTQLVAFNLFVFQGDRYSGQLMAAKRFIREFASYRDFYCVTFSIGATEQEVKGIWTELGRQFNLPDATPAQITQLVYGKVKDRHCVFFIEIPPEDKSPGIEEDIATFWKDFQEALSSIYKAEECPNHCIFFILDKRGRPDASYVLAKKTYSTALAPSPIPDFKTPFLIAWHQRQSGNEAINRGSFKLLDFNSFDAEYLKAQNTVLKICDLCGFSKIEPDNPYNRIFTKYEEI